MAIPNDFPVVQQLAGEGYFDRVAAGDQRAASYFARLFAFRANPAGDPSGWGALKKGGGTNVEGYAEDAVVYGSDPSDVNNVYDLVGGTGAPGATPSWNGPKARRTSDTWEAPHALSAEQMNYLKSGSGSGEPTGPSSWTPAHTSLLAQLPAETKAIAEHLAFAFPGESWGQKRADPNRPVSGDVIARKVGSTIVGYRVVPKPAGAPAEISLMGQVFVPVTPVDHLHGTPVPVPPPTPAPTPALPPYPGDLKGIEVGKALFGDYAEAGRPLDEGSGIWFLRVSYDYLAGMSLDAAKAKHRAAWRAALGLQPV